jgi:hypothetical protein
MNKLAALLAAAIFAINLMPLSAEAAIPKAAESENDAVGVASDVPKPGKAKAASGATLATKSAAKSAKPAKSTQASEANVTRKKPKNSKGSLPAKKPANRS